MGLLDDAMGRIESAEAKRAAELELRATYGVAWHELGDLTTYLARRSLNKEEEPDAVQLVEEFCQRIPEGAGKPAFALRLLGPTTFYLKPDLKEPPKYASQRQAKQFREIDRERYEKAMRVFEGADDSRILTIGFWSPDYSRNWCFARRDGRWIPVSRRESVFGMDDDWPDVLGLGGMLAGYLIDGRGDLS